MFEIFGIPSQALFGQLLLGLINGSFYALLSLGLAVIFGMLNIINFTHGAQYMMGAFAAFMLLSGFDVPIPHFSGGIAVDYKHIDPGINYWWALILAPLLVGLTGIVIERLLLQASAQARSAVRAPAHLRPGARSSKACSATSTARRASPIRCRMRCRAAAISASCSCRTIAPGSSSSRSPCVFATWFAIERTRLGSYLRAATENPALVRAFGINVPRMVTLTYGFGVALAALAGVMAAPIYKVSPQMGSDLIIVVFAVVVIGGMGSILGAIVTGFALGIVEGLTKVFYPEASNTVIFVIMAIVLLIRPAGLFGRNA